MIMWSQLEPNLAITCACVPLLRPVFKRTLPDQEIQKLNNQGHQWPRENSIHSESRTDTTSTNAIIMGAEGGQSFARTMGGDELAQRNSSQTVLC